MQPDFSKLPPPPKGQTGVTLEQFSHLPPPPTGQQGFTLDEISGNTTRDTQQAPSVANMALQGIGKSAKENLVDPFTSRLKDINFEGQNSASNALQTGGALAGGVVDVFSKGLKGAYQAVTPQGVQDKVSQGLDKATNAIASQVSPEAVAKFEQIRKEHPELSANIDAALNIASIIPGEGLVRKGVQQGLNVLEKTGKGAVDTSKLVASKIPKTFKSTDLSKVIKKGMTKDEKITSKVNDLITPKPTTSEAKQLTREGRLIKGKEGGFLTKGTLDKVIPSKEGLRITETIKRNIPEIGKIKNDTELYSILNKKVTDVAVKLKPELQKVKLKQETINKINSDLEKVKKTQLENALATEEPNTIKKQAQFEKFLQKSGSENLDDLWETAKNYDKSIKSNVKNATDLSDPSLYAQKQEWLSNRKIIKDAINNSTNGLGKTSEQAFSDMHDMYNAQEQILTKAEFTKEKDPSKLSKFLDSKTGKVLKYGGGALIGNKLIKQETGFGF